MGILLLFSHRLIVSFWNLLIQNMKRNSKYKKKPLHDWIPRRPEFFSVFFRIVFILFFGINIDENEAFIVRRRLLIYLWQQQHILQVEISRVLWVDLWKCEKEWDSAQHKTSISVENAGLRDFKSKSSRFETGGREWMLCEKHPKQQRIKRRGAWSEIDHLLNFYVLLKVYYRKTTTGELLKREI